MRSNWIVLAFLSCCVIGGAARAGENWPQFRGPTGQGVSDAKNLPLNWSETQSVTWKTPIHGKAWSSPVIWGNQIWLTTAPEDGRQLFVVTIDKETGKVIRDQKLFDVPDPQFCHPFNSYASPTPAIEEGRIYVTFGSPGTACLDTTTGSVLWERRDFVCNHFRGSGSSLLIWGDLLIYPFDGSDYQYIVALDKKTGKTVWRTERSVDFKDIQPNGKPLGDGDYRKAFSTPRVMDFGQGPVLISEGSKCLYAYEPATGKELWRSEYRNSHSAGTTPFFGHGMMFYVTGVASPELWAVRGGGHGVVNDTNVAWRVNRGAPGRPSPILVDDLIYMVTDGGLVSCVEAETGKIVWHGRFEGTFSSAPISAAGRVYFFNEDGKSTVIATGRELKVLAENQLSAGCMASPAVSGDALFVRTKTGLYRIETPATGR